MEALQGNRKPLHVEQMRGAETSNSLEGRIAALYAAHRDGVYRFLARLGIPPAEAQEETCEVFSDLFAALISGIRVNRPHRWIYAQACRRLVDYRQREGDAVVCFPETAETAPQCSSGGNMAATRTPKTQRLWRIAATMTSLPIRQQLCLQLRVQGLPYREIGEALGVSAGTAADWLVVATARLKGVSQ